MELKTEEQVIELIGKDTALEFQCLVDNVMDYKTVLPVLVDGSYVYYLISLFYEDSQPFLNYENLNKLSRFKIFEVIEITETNNITETLYHKKFI